MIMKNLKLLKNITGVVCPKCDEFIWSKHRHDFHYCECKYTFVDGGRDYLRYGYGEGGEAEQENPQVESCDIIIDVKTGKFKLFPIEKLTFVQEK